MIIKNLNELNDLLLDGEQKIVEHENGAKFEVTKMDKIKLVLYENGISLFNGPFRSFSDAKTRLFCVDIMDGYFPSELQTKYPEGVPFEVIDKREVYFKDQHNKVYETEGYRLGTRDDADEDGLYSKKKIESQLSGL